MPMTKVLLILLICAAGALGAWRRLSGRTMDEPARFDLLTVLSVLAFIAILVTIIVSS